jgi:hypothetical protein
MMCAISATFGLKGLIDCVHNQMHGSQHVSQHGVGLNLEVIWFEFNGDMPIAQVIGRTSEVEWRAVLRARCDAKQCLRRSFNANQTAIIGYQHITTSNHMTTLQKYGQHTTRRVLNLKAAFLPNIPV